MRIHRRYTNILHVSDNVLCPTNSRQVATQDGKRLADELKANFIETSAKTNVNIGEYLSTAAVLVSMASIYAHISPLIYA